MKQRVAPYVSPLPRHLTTIPEEGEASRTSSQASLLKPGTSFTNRAAVEMYEQETSMTEPAPLGEIDNKTEGRGMSFSNKTALDLEQGTVTEKELAEAEGLPGRGTTITTSFRNVVPMSKLNGSMQGSEDRPSPKPHDSPLLRHVPRGTPIAPADVKGNICSVEILIIQLIYVYSSLLHTRGFKSWQAHLHSTCIPYKIISFQQKKT